LAALNDEVDVVYGCPETQTHGLWRDLASVITKLTLQKAMGSRTAGMASAYRVFRTRLRDAFANYNNPFVSIDVLLTWGTTRFTALKIAHQPRHSGESNYTFAKLLTHAANMLTGFTDLPLKLASLLGFALTFFGLGVLVYVVGGYLLNGTTVAGFPFIASVIAIFSGAQLFALGIIGEYLARIHFRTMDKPSYAVGDTTDDSA
jgi:undecaprenyl-phosphate 4-deoxy-4-formamido-L-arabinose transferase